MNRQAVIGFLVGVSINQLTEIFSTPWLTERWIHFGIWLASMQKDSVLHRFVIVSATWILGFLLVHYVLMLVASIRHNRTPSHVTEELKAAKDERAQAVTEKAELKERFKQADQRILELHQKSALAEEALQGVMSFANTLASHLAVIAGAQADAEAVEWCISQLCSDVTHALGDRLFGGTIPGKVAFVYMDGDLFIDVEDRRYAQEFQDKFLDIPIIRNALDAMVPQYFDDLSSNQSLLRTRDNSFAIKHCGSLLLAPLSNIGQRVGVVGVYCEASNFFVGKRNDFAVNFLLSVLSVAASLRHSSDDSDMAG